MAKCKVCGKQIPRGSIMCNDCTEALRMQIPPTEDEVTKRLKSIMSKPNVKEATYDRCTNIYTIKLADDSIFKSSDLEAWYGPGSMSRVKSPWLYLQQSKTVTANNTAPLSSCTFIKPPEDIIGHPNHYCEGRKFEPKDVIRDWNLNFNLGNAVKYISRNGRKDGNSALQDLKKARQYLDFEIEYLEKEV